MGCLPGVSATSNSHMWSLPRGKRSCTLAGRSSSEMSAGAEERSWGRDAGRRWRRRPGWGSGLRLPQGLSARVVPHARPHTRWSPFCRRNSSPCVRVCRLGLLGEPATGETGRWVSIILIMPAAWPVLLSPLHAVQRGQVAPED